jgi:heme A synthase
MGRAAMPSPARPPSPSSPRAAPAGAAPAAAARFRRFAWALVAYNLGVVAWGAFVRATGSGAGCGNHWPLCNGEVLPRPEAVETLIELTHRLTSGLDGLLVLGLLVWAWRLFPPRHAARTAAALSFVFLVVEALVGAGLVRFDLVADDASTARAVVMAVHLVNTFLLLASLALTATWAGPAGAGRRLPLRLAPSDPAAWLLAGALAGLALLGVSGAIAALGDTLFPAAGLREGLAQDFSPTAHLLLRLRVLHPVIALGLGVYLTAAAMLVARLRPRRAVRRRAHAVAWLFVAQLGLGLLNLALGAPVWLQLVHLVAADLVWLALVLLTAEVAHPRAAEAAPAPVAAPVPAAAGGGSHR